MDFPFHIHTTSVFPISGLLCGIFHFYSIFDEIFFIKSNREDPDQTALSAAFELGLIGMSGP